MKSHFIAFSLAHFHRFILWKCHEIVGATLWNLRLDFSYHFFLSDWYDCSIRVPHSKHNNNSGCYFLIVFLVLSLYILTNYNIIIGTGIRMEGNRMAAWTLTLLFSWFIYLFYLSMLYSLVLVVQNACCASVAFVNNSNRIVGIVQILFSDCSLTQLGLNTCQTEYH